MCWIDMNQKINTFEISSSGKNLYLFLYIKFVS